MFQDVFYICIGACAGALCRWLLSLALNNLFPILPPGTLLANVLGSFLMGLLTALFLHYAAFSHTLRPLLLTGFLGSFTTFSTFAAEMGQLILKDKFAWLSLGLLLHVGASIALFLFGLWLGGLIKSSSVS